MLGYLPSVRDSGPGAPSRADGAVQCGCAALLADSECAGWAPVHPAGVHAGGVSRVDRAGGGGDGREVPTHGGASLDPANRGHSLLTSDGGAGVWWTWNGPQLDILRLLTTCGCSRRRGEVDSAAIPLYRSPHFE